MTLVDANVLLDLFTRDDRWAPWSIDQLRRAALNGPLLINDIIYAEVSIRFSSSAALDRQLEALNIESELMSREILFSAGKAFKRFRDTETNRTSILPDFFIGAHSEALCCPLLTRDPRRFRTYFPTVELITP